MYKHRITALVVLVIVVSLLIVTPPRSKATRFIISAWSGPDEYGQRLSSIYIHENSTGSWVAIKDPAFWLPSDPTSIEVNGSRFYRFQPTVHINHTLLGLGDYDDAKKITRVGVEVSIPTAILVSQTNITGDNGEGIQTPTTWWLGFDFIMPFRLVDGEIYTVVFTYEIYM